MAKLSVMLPLSLVVICSVLALPSVADVLQVDGFGRIVGGREKIPDVKNNQEIQDLGRYSVAEYNKNTKKYQQKGNRSDGQVTFYAVVEAEKQVVSGIKYYLKISATSSSGVPKTFEAVVVVQAWKAQPRELLTFSPSPPTK